MSKRDRNRLDAFGRAGDLEEVADEIYGASAPSLDVGRVVAVPTPIDTIWADVKQPRRAVPASIRLHWNGNPDDVAELLNQWHMIASKTASIDVYAILQGNGEGLAFEDAPAIFMGYLELLRLAASIVKEGLINPISIIEEGGRFLIETGERRWLAYHILRAYMGESWGKVPASRSNGRDYVWRQATENTARRQLNAIGMARQLALLIMETRRGLDGQEYNDYDELVLSGGCDRKFYAQIANGNIHRIPRGMGERIQGAMNLSEKRIADYRKLLKLTEDDVVNDALWIRGDVEDWPEFTLREIHSTLQDGKVREIVTAENWTLADLREAMEGAKSTPPQPQSNLTPSPSPQAERGVNADKVPTPPEPIVTFQVLDKVRTPAGHMGTVIRVSGRHVDVQTVNGVRVYFAEGLTLMSRTRDESEEPPPLPRPQSIGEGKESNAGRLPIQRVTLEDYPEVERVSGYIPPNTHFYIIRHGGAEWQFLNAMREAARLLEDKETERTMTEIIEMTSTKLDRLGSGRKMLLDQYWEYMLQVLSDWQEVRFQGILHQLETGGRDD